MKPSAINEFFYRLCKERPEPETELKYLNTFTLLVAVVLSAQATDASVNKATKALFEKVATPKDMIMLGEAGLKTYIKTIGLFNNKAKNIIALSQKLLDEFEGQVPNTLEDLQSLPGVGQKTANVILNVAFGATTIAVDTHVFRVANRTGLATATTPELVESKLLKVIPEKWKKHAHHWLILHGRYVCKARTPQCMSCIVHDLCSFKNKTLS